MNPVALPMYDLDIREHDGFDWNDTELRLALEHALEVARHHFHEQLGGDRPVGQQPRRQGAVRVPHLPLEQLEHQRHVVLALERLQIDEFGVAAPCECPLSIEDVRNAAAHPRGEIAPGPAKDEHAAAGHVLASVIPDALNDGDRAAIANGKSFASETADVRLAARRAV